MKLTDVLMALNYAVVLLYGVTLTASFAGALKSRRDWLRVILFFVAMLAVQVICSQFWGMQAIERLYPVLTHLPLAVFLVVFCGRKVKESFPSIFIAYLCCIPRQWLGILATALTSRSVELSYIVQILCSVPLLFITMRFLSSTINRALGHSRKTVLLLTAAPVMYYVLVYATTVYSDLLYSGSSVALGLLMCVVVFSYLVFALMHFREIQKRNEAETLRDMLRLQTEQAVKDLEVMRKSQQQAATYRHDLRHHFQYLAACIDAGKMEEARDYIRQTSETIEGQKVISYCENESVNLILSSYQTNADAAEVEMDVQITLSEPLVLPSDALCVILSNALENALRACQTFPPGQKGTIEVSGFQKNGKTFFQIQNTYKGDIAFKGGRPVADREGHGLGTLSIVETVNSCGGLCSFTADNGLFTLRFWM